MTLGSRLPLLLFLTPWGLAPALAGCSANPGGATDKVATASAALKTTSRAVAADGDTFVAVTGMNENYGAIEELVAQEPTKSRALVRFERSSIAAAVAHADLRSARLELTLDSLRGPPVRDPIAIAARRMTTDWSELGATWHCASDADTENSRPDCDDRWLLVGPHAPWVDAATDTAPIEAAPPGSKISLDVLSDVEPFLSSATENAMSWVIGLDEKPPYHDVHLRSRETADGPRLVLDVQCQPQFFEVDGTCQSCGCDAVGASDLACNDDGACTCRAGYTGLKCDACAPTFFRGAGGTCGACACDAIGSASAECSATGACACNAGYTGPKCSACATGYYRSNGVCAPCGCNPSGASSASCNASGVCSCKTGYQGAQCNECAAGYFSNGSGVCQACGCHSPGSASNSCDTSGNCSCRAGYTGAKCDGLVAEWDLAVIPSSVTMVWDQTSGNDLWAIPVPLENLSKHPVSAWTKCQMGSVTFSRASAGTLQPGTIGNFNLASFLGPRSALPPENPGTAQCWIDQFITAGVADENSANDSATMTVTFPSTPTFPTRANVTLIRMDPFECSTLVDLSHYNYGPPVASTPTCLNLYIGVESSHGGWQYSCNIDGSTQSQPGAADGFGGGSLGMYKSFNFGVLGAGTHQITCTVDSGNTVHETNEGDNTVTKTVSL